MLEQIASIGSRQTKPKPRRTKMPTSQSSFDLNLIINEQTNTEFQTKRNVKSRKCLVCVRYLSCGETFANNSIVQSKCSVTLTNPKGYKYKEGGLFRSKLNPWFSTVGTLHFQCKYLCIGPTQQKLKQIENLQPVLY